MGLGWGREAREVPRRRAAVLGFLCRAGLSAGLGAGFGFLPLLFSFPFSSLLPSFFFLPFFPHLFFPLVFPLG